jgi:hypothetical protein
MKIKNDCHDNLILQLYILLGKDCNTRKMLILLHENFNNYSTLILLILNIYKLFSDLLYYYNCDGNYRKL